MSGNYRTSRNIWKPLVLVINTGLIGSSGVTQFALPLRSSVSYQGGSLTPDYRFKVDWGDGIVENLTISSQAGRTHSYTASGTYSVSIYGRCDALDFQAPSDSTKIIRLNSWGNVVNRALIRNFSGAINLISVTSSPPILERVNLLEETFFGCSGLTALNVSNWNVSNVTNMYGTFRECSLLSDMDVSNWNISKVQTLSLCFYLCSSLDPQVSSWNFSSVTNMSNTFRESGITSVTASSWNLSNLQTANNMFYGCSSLKSFYAPNLNLSSLSIAAGSFQGTGLTGSIQISSWTLSSLTTADSMFNGTQLRYFDSTGMKISTNLTNITAFLANNEQLIAATISNLINDSEIDGPYLTFVNCYKLTSVDTVNWTRRLTTFNSCFLNCTSLSSINVSTWDTASVSNFDSTFDNCQSLTTISCSNWTMSSVTTAVNMFRGVTLSQTTYDQILTGWVGWIGGTATRIVQDNVQFHAGNSKYTTASDAASARNYLITVKGWSITDGGANDPVD